MKTYKEEVLLDFAEWIAGFTYLSCLSDKWIALDVLGDEARSIKGVTTKELFKLFLKKRQDESTNISM